MTIYLLAGLIVVSIVLIIYALLPSKNSDTDTIKRRMTGRSAQSSIADIRRQAKASVAKRVMETVTPIAVKPVMLSNTEEMSKLRMKLAAAGIRAENAPTTFLASKTIMAILMGAAGALVAWGRGEPLMNGAGFTMFGAAIGLFLPNLWLGSAISKRSTAIRQGLPDTLDLLVISVESGLGLDAALQRVGDEMRAVHPCLAEEMQIVTMEAQMGIPRSEALENFAVRTGIDEVRSLIAIINQAERFGTSIARALRNQSEALRTKRRQAAEERAQKTTVKLMAPLILFIFPAILVVLAADRRP